MSEQVLRLQARPGLVENGESRLFRLFSAEESLGTVDALHGKISASRFHPLGTFISGDIVCALDDGKLFVVLHDDSEVLESGVELDEFADRLEALDPKLEEDVYTRRRSVAEGRDGECHRQTRRDNRACRVGSRTPDGVEAWLGIRHAPFTRTLVAGSAVVTTSDGVRFSFENGRLDSIQIA